MFSATWLTIAVFLASCLLSSSLHLGRIRAVKSSRYQLSMAEETPTNPPIDIIPQEISTAEFLKKGVVLLAQPSEEHDFFNKAAILIYDYGTDRGTTGVILERETAFSMGETTPNCGPFEPNTLFLGGESGSDTAIMFHKYDLEGFSKYIGAGMYLGGIKEAKELVVSRKAHPRDFKFIFNSVEWETGVLEREILSGRWDMSNVPPNLILQQSRAREVDSIWLNVRKVLQLRLID